MNNYREIIVSLLIRLAVGTPFLVIGLVILARAGGSASTAHGYAMGLFGCAGVILGSVILAFPLASLIAEPVGSLFYPGRRSSRPSPMYGIPESKRARGLYEEAMTGFEKISEEYPDEVKPFIEMIDISIVNLKDPERANAIYRHGAAVLKKREDQEALARMYSAIRSRLGSKPSN